MHERVHIGLKQRGKEMFTVEDRKERIVVLLDELKMNYGIYDIEEYKVFRMSMTLSEESQISSIDMILKVSDDDIIIISTCDIKASAKSRVRMSEYINRANYGLLNGNFELDFNEGTIRFKIYLDIKDQEITKYLLFKSIVLSSKMWERYGNGVVRILGSDDHPADIIQIVEAD